MSTKTRHELKHPASQRRWGRAFGWLSALIIAGLPVLATAEPFTVRDAKTSLANGVYRLDARVDYTLSAQALEALDNGVPLTLALDIEVYRPRRYVWDEIVASLEQRFRIQYQALTDQYLVRNLNSGSQAVYPVLDDALSAVGKIQELPILDAQLLTPGERYMVRVRSRLDFESLSAPLRLRAYVYSDWWLDSGWYSWDLVPAP